MLEDILKVADKYADGVAHVRERRQQWQTKHEELKEHLEKIADYLDEKSEYKQGFFVDVLHAFNETMHGTCAEMPSISFRSGDMPMLITFRNSMGERKEYVEEGFSITFTPTITGQILVMLQPHYSDLNEKQPDDVALSVIDKPGLLTMDVVDRIVATGMDLAHRFSFTGMAEQIQMQEQPQIEQPIIGRNPIGFKRYETTQRPG